MKKLGITIAIALFSIAGLCQPNTSPNKSPAAAKKPASVTRIDSKAATILVPATKYMNGDSTYQRLWGPGLFVMDALADINIGTVKGLQYLVAHRFRAPASGTIASIRPYWTSGAGYAAGNGGKISVRITADDGSSGHLPNLTAAPLGTGVYEPGLVLGRHIFSSFSDTVKLSALAPVRAGNLYHVVYENLAPNPSSDYIGVNHMVTVEKNGHPARWLQTSDWAALFAFRKAFGAPFEWKDVTSNSSSGLYYAPILEVTMSNGLVFGAVKVEAGNIEGAGQWIVTAASPIREQFMPRMTKNVVGFSVQTATASAGELEWTLRDGAKVLASGSITEPAANYASVFNTRLTQGIYTWYDVAFGAVVTMNAGASYDLELRPKGAAQWRFTDEFNGTEKGYAMAFSESRAQALVAGNWLSANHRDHSKASHPSNWRVVLHLAP